MIDADEPGLATAGRAGASSLPSSVRQLQGKSLLVTGAAGFIGGALCRRLASYGCNVTATVLDPSEVETLCSQGVKAEVLDLASDESFDRHVQGIDIVFHIAAMFQETEHGEAMYRKINDEGALKLEAGALEPSRSGNRARRRVGRIAFGPERTCMVTPTKLRDAARSGGIAPERWPERTVQEPILIIGATGFAGGALAKRLRGEGRSVRALVRAGSDESTLEQLGVEIVRGDITAADAVERASDGIGTVYNFASPFRSAKPSDQYFWDVNVGGVLNVIEAARRQGVGRVVHCSTIGVHGDVKEIPCREESPYNPGDVYQRTKLEAELRFRDAMAVGLPGVVMRPVSMYGPGDLRMLKMFRLVSRGKWWTVGDGSAWFHCCYIDDLVSGFVLCGEHPDAVGQVFILPGPSPVRLRELVTLVAEALGVSPPRRRLPLGPMLIAARLCERVCRPLGVEPPLHERRVRFFTNNRSFDGTRAREILGFAPKVALTDGLRRTAEWYRQQGLL